MRIGAFDLDFERGLLSRDGSVVHLRPKTFAFLSHLARNAGRVVCKDDLMQALWPNVTVSEESLTQLVRDLRRVLGKELLQTVSRRGYLLNIPRDPTPPQTGSHPPLVVILPFQTGQTNPVDTELADGLVEEVIQALGRYGLVRIIARHSAFQCRPDTIRLREAAVKLGADWFVEGSVRWIGSALRLSAALCETASGRHVWSATLDVDPTRPNEAPASLAHQIVTRLTLDTEKRLMLRPAVHSADLGAWQHLIAGVSALRRYGEGANAAARDHLLQALDRDPALALAHTYLGLAEAGLGGYDLAPTEVLDSALSHALRGADLAPDEARCHAILGLLRQWRGEFAAAEMSARQAVQLNPSDPDLMVILGYVIAMRGRPEEGLIWMEAGARLNPLRPGWYHSDMAIALHMAGRPAEAIAHIQCLPVTGAWKETRLAACYALMGDGLGAARHLAKAERASPGWDALAEVTRWAATNSEADRSYFVEQIKLALSMRDRLARPDTCLGNCPQDGSPQPRE